MQRTTQKRKNNTEVYLEVIQISMMARFYENS